MRAWIVPALICAIALPGLSGCAGLVIGGAAAGAVIVHDRRTTGTMLDDQSIKRNSKKALREDEELRKLAHINITSFNNIVLISGEAPNSVLKQRAGKIVSGIAKIRHVHNEMTIAAPSSYMSRTSDSLITTKVKAKMVGLKDLEDFDTTRVKVVTENGVVFLMGLLKHNEATAATEAVRRVGGVQKVIKLFEYLD
ncbi:MAG: BON domain-containing protein [Gammaproteobacteria bacterium]